MDWKVDLDVTCKLCGKSACRVYKTDDNLKKYKCFSGCGEYTVNGEQEPERELVDTKPIKSGKSA